MAALFASRTPSLDYFSLTPRNSETAPSTSPCRWDQTPYSDPALQSPTSDESLAVSPVSPFHLPFTRGAYALPLEQGGFHPKADPSIPYSSSFDEWMGWDGSLDPARNAAVRSHPQSLKPEPVSPIMEALQLSGGVGALDNRTMMSAMDDSVAFQDAMNEEPLFQAPSEMQPQQPGILYSNWSQPPPVYQSGQPSNHPFQSLNSNEATALISIAMPPSPIPTAQSSSQASNRRKRKSSSSSTGSVSSASSSRHPQRRPAPVKKTAHNMIEKRYRTNLNDKIAALRDSVPSLQVADGKLSQGDAGMEDLHGLDAPHKLNKATILAKATEYIAHLESRNTYLSKECKQLKDRVEAFERLLMTRSGPAGRSNGNGLGQGQTHGNNMQSQMAHNGNGNTRGTRWKSHGGHRQ